MVEIHISGDSVTLEVLGLHKVWALKSRLQFPLSSITGVRCDPQFADHPRGLRAPGTYIPRVVTAGTFYADKKRWFWDVCNPNESIVIELEGEKYQILVIEVENPGAAVAQLEAARTGTQ